MKIKLHHPSNNELLEEVEEKNLNEIENMAREKRT